MVFYHQKQEYLRREGLVLDYNGSYGSLFGTAKQIGTGDRAKSGDRFSTKKRAIC